MTEAEKLRLALVRAKVALYPNLYRLKPLERKDQ